MARRPRLADRDLRRFTRLMSARMTDFDCASLCAPNPGEIPPCCDNRETVPVLYRDEYRRYRRRTDFWKKHVPTDRAGRKLAEQMASYNVLAECPGPRACRRSLRALVCRMFPFEPHLDEEGRVVGLVYQEERSDRCPLVGKPRSLYNDRYIRNSIIFWSELLDRLPDEKEMYLEESRKLRRRCRRRGVKPRVFR
jgi:hypothetical protein